MVSGNRDPSLSALLLTAGSVVCRCSVAACPGELGRQHARFPKITFVSHDDTSMALTDKHKVKRQRLDRICEGPPGSKQEHFEFGDMPWVEFEMDATSWCPLIQPQLRKRDLGVVVGFGGCGALSIGVLVV
ncbi:C-terminal-binding protein 2 isoform X1 [Arapaima gigas]